MQVDNRLLDAVGPAVAEALALRLVDKVTVIERRPVWHLEQIVGTPLLRAVLDFITPPTASPDRYREPYAVLVIMLRRAGYVHCQLSDSAICRTFGLPMAKIRHYANMAESSFDRAAT